MKKILSTIIFALTLISFTACSTKPSGLSKMPVVLQGKLSDISVDKRLTLVKAGTYIPVHISIKGDAFKNDVNKTFPVILKDDTYLYGADGKLWVSHDKQNWYTMDDAFDGKVFFTVNVTPQISAINLGFEANRK